MMADLVYISKASALIALDGIQYWNPEDRYRAKKAIYELPAEETEPECKSADEMFRELGYTVKKHSEILESTMYSKPKNRNKTVDEISCDRNGVFTAYHKFGGFETYCMNSREILACAQLIKEMEVSDNAQTVAK